MQYGEAFKKLGYTLTIPRTDWSAENGTGVCISIWRDEIDWNSEPISMDSRVRGGRHEDWANKAGNKKRRFHIQAALEKYDGWIDAVIVDGSSKEGVDKASPWLPKDRKGVCWRITDFDLSTGHVTLSALTKI